MRFTLVVLSCILLSLSDRLSGQNLGIGTVDPKAALEIMSTDSGILIPRLTTSQRNNITTASTIDGMLIYNTDLDQFEFYDHGDGWKAVASASSLWTSSGNNIYAANSGNVGIGNNNPAYKFDLTGEARIRSGSGIGVLRIGDNWVGNPTYGTTGVQIGLGTDYMYLGMHSDGTNQNDAVLMWADDGDDDLRFVHYHYAYGEREWMRLFGDGTLRVANLGGSGNRMVVVDNDGDLSTQSIPSGGGSGNWTTSGNNQYHSLSGNVGIGTSNPQQKLHIEGNLRLGDNDQIQFDGTSTYIKEQSNDLELYAADDLELRPSDDLMIYGDQVKFYDGNSQYAVFDNDQRRLGINTNSPSTSLHIRKSGSDLPLRIENLSRTSYYNTVLTISTNGYVYKRNGAYFSSDLRFKKEVNPIEDPLVHLLQLRGVSYYFRFAEQSDMDWPSQQQMGVIAQEVEQVYPYLVSTDEAGYKAVNYLALSALLIESVKEMHQEKEALADELHQLQNQYQDLADRLKALEEAQEKP
ncbi:MAG: tail fiber domain-containing protein [Bacteroidota bacterium]